MRIIVIAVIMALAGCNHTNTDAANASAEEFVKKIDGATGFDCANQDTDRNGYVACTVFRKDADPLLIECGSERFCVNCARGCKYTQLKVPR
jgi:hypothetical protein